jgi:hypothetical protein
MDSNYNRLVYNLIIFLSNGSYSLNNNLIPSKSLINMLTFYKNLKKYLSDLLNDKKKYLYNIDLLLINKFNNIQPSYDLIEKFNNVKSIEDLNAIMQEEIDKIDQTNSVEEFMRLYLKEPVFPKPTPISGELSDIIREEGDKLYINDLEITNNVSYYSIEHNIDIKPNTYYFRAKNKFLYIRDDSSITNPNFYLLYIKFLDNSWRFIQQLDDGSYKVIIDNMNKETA